VCGGWRPHKTNLRLHDPGRVPVGPCYCFVLIFHSTPATRQAQADLAQPERVAGGDAAAHQQQG